MAAPASQPAEPAPAAEVRRLLGERADPLLQAMEREAAERGLDVLGPVAAGLVAVLARARGGRDLLELGTAMGYTSVWLGRVAREMGGRVTSVEKDPARVAEARASLARAGLDGVVQVVEGDALAFLQAPGAAFDLVVLNIGVAEYAAALPALVERMRPGALLVANHASAPQAAEFLSLALSDERLDTSVLHGFWPCHTPEWDTLLVAVRRDSPTGARAGPLG